MNNKKNITILIISLIAIIIALSLVIINLLSTRNNVVTPYTESPVIESPAEPEVSDEFQIPESGNDTIIKTSTSTTLRFINEYDKNLFKKNKNLLIMFGSWCPNCQEEISEIEKILDYYENNKNIDVILIAHEYQNTIKDLKSLIENDVDFKDEEVFIDLKRTIRKEIDPEASTIPISYVVDKKGNILSSYDDSLTLKQAQEMLK